LHTGYLALQRGERRVVGGPRRHESRSNGMSRV
jgi:hypothetical protein